MKTSKFYFLEAVLITSDSAEDSYSESFVSMEEAQEVQIHYNKLGFSTLITEIESY